MRRAAAVGERPRDNPARLSARPGGDPLPHPLVGLHPLGLGGTRDALVYAPHDYSPDRPLPFVLTLHGAGGTARKGVSWLLPLANEFDVILLSPKSRAQTWDVIMGRYGTDVDFVDVALARTFERYAVDASRLAISGFSDGASYALSLGLANGDLFTHVIAFSPGFAAPPATVASPSIFISHGVDDRVLPIDRTSRRLVPAFHAAGYDVRYEEFDAGHTPDPFARDALEWLTRGS